MAGSALHLFWIMLIDAAGGDSRRLYRHVRHPVVWMGALLARLEGRFNCPVPNAAQHPPCRSRAIGTACLGLYLALLVLPALLLQHGLYHLVPPEAATLILLLLASSLIAARSLHDHVQEVRRALLSDDLAAARTAVGRIVGRDVSRLDRSDVARAALESLAENFSDGVMAPCFWYLVAGFPGLVAYKAVNTADSMIGHRNDRYRHFGWAAARLDDLANLIPARLTALLILIAAALLRGVNPFRALNRVRREAPAHASPNAGWPEAALAHALALRLGGPRRYGTEELDGAWFGAGRARAEAADIGAGLHLLGLGWLLLVTGLLAANLVAAALLAGGPL